MNTPIAVTELVEWIMANRKGDAFKDDSYENLIAGVQEDIAHHELLFVLDDKDQLIGVTTFSPDDNTKVLFVRNILVTKYSAVRILAQHFKDKYDGYTIVGHYNNKETMYDTSRLINHLLNMKERH